MLFEGGRAVGVRARPRGGEPEEIRARVVVDASGQGAFLSRKLGLRRFDPKLKRAALFAHYENVRWPEESTPGDILLPIDRGVWYWIIPFSDGTCSVGGVFDPAAVRLPRRRGARGPVRGDARAFAPDAEAARRARAGPPGSTASRTTRRRPDRLAGDGWVLVGDAAAFLDPVFSTGVFLAMSTGERAALAIDGALARRGRVDARDFRAYAR